MAETPDATLQLQIAPSSGTTYTRRSLPVRVQFENVGTEDVILLRCFRPSPVFFSVSMVREDGTPIPLPGGGKIDFGPAPIPYLRLGGGEFFGLTLDIADLVPASAEVPPGAYRIAVTYHNQYGEGCFRGRLDSNAIEVALAPEGARRDGGVSQ